MRGGRPGSGKTTVLVERFRRLVCEAGISPSRILAITFTEKAATNMKQKLAEAFRDRPEDRRQLERAYVSTVHGFCMRLLRENAIFAGIDPEFRVMDERQADHAAGVAVNEALDRMFAENPDAMRRLMEGLGGTNLAGAVMEVYEALRVELADGSPGRCLALSGRSFARSDRPCARAGARAAGRLDGPAARRPARGDRLGRAPRASARPARLPRALRGPGKFRLSTCAACAGVIPSTIASKR